VTWTIPPVAAGAAIAADPDADRAVDADRAAGSEAAVAAAAAHALGVDGRGPVAAGDDRAVIDDRDVAALAGRAAVEPPIDRLTNRPTLTESPPLPPPPPTLWAKMPPEPSRSVTITP
jgi:hypothetical protein